MVTIHEIKTLVQSYHPLVVIETGEEERVLKHLETACEELDSPLFTWSLASGLAKAPSKHAILASTNSPLVALRHIDDLAVEGVFLLLDFAPHLENPAVARQFREVIQKFSRTRSCFVVTGHQVRLPGEIENSAVHFDMRFPDSGELGKVIDSALRSLKPLHDVSIHLNPTERNTLINALNGMTLNQARQSIASAMIEDGVLDAADISRVIDRKAKLIRDNGLLEYFPALDNSFKLGGFENLKHWLKRAATGFTPEAKALNLPAPRGILLVGVQGCGKSLAAKAIARLWNAPLLKLDAGSLYDKYLGETERNLRKAFKLAESLSPVVLWLDEIEKAFATGSARNGATDSGTSMRVLGTFLTWLQEKKDSVFVVGTANNLELLPPELLRKGRFDEIFFVDLPDAEERSEIFEIHLRLKKQDPADFDLDKLVAITEGFSGAEIEQAVVAALYRALFAKRALDTDFLLDEILETVPLSVSRSEDITRLRQYAEGRFVSVRRETDPLKILPHRRHGALIFGSRFSVLGSIFDIRYSIFDIRNVIRHSTFDPFYLSPSHLLPSPSPMPTIDSHHHFWKYSPEDTGWISDDMKVLQRDFLPADLEKETAAAGVDAVVSVQARQTLEETAWLLELARKHDFVAGVVGWVPLIDDSVAGSLDRFGGDEKLVAVRHVLQGEEDDDYMLRDDFNRGVAILHDFGLAYDILIYQKHLPQSVAFVDKHPDQVFVLDHIAKPVIETAGPPEAWSKPIAELAKRENVYCKISGMVTEVRPDTWDADFLKPYFEHVLEAFGPARLMFGTDWPVCLLRAEYGQWTRTVRDFIATLSEAEQTQIMGATAAKAYNL